MDRITLWLRANNVALLRYSLALVLFWIGALKFADPAPVVGLLDASLPFLAFAGLVYVLGVFELTAAALLVWGTALRAVTPIVAGMFGGTLLIFVVAPAVSYTEAGFPMLSLAGEFLLKDIVLLAATLSVFAAEPVGATRTQPEVIRNRGVA